MAYPCFPYIGLQIEIETFYKEEKILFKNCCSLFLVGCWRDYSLNIHLKTTHIKHISSTQVKQILNPYSHYLDKDSL